LKVKLPHTFAELRSGNADRLEWVLDGELADLVNELIDDDPDGQGGGIDDAAVEVQAIRTTPAGAVATLLFTYTQLIPSGCRDMPHTEPGSYSMHLTLRHGETEADLDSPQADWDTTDFNSSADGR
jgi:hypothetical protein